MREREKEERERKIDREKERIIEVKREDQGRLQRKITRCIRSSEASRKIFHTTLSKSYTTPTGGIRF